MTGPRDDTTKNANDMRQQEEPQPTLAQTITRTVSGAIAGAAGIAAGQPFDTVKVRLQTQNYGANILYKGPIHCAVRTVKEEGVRALFKGMLSPIIANAPINAVLFSVEHYTGKVLSSEKWRSRLSIDARNFLAGSISGLSQVLISCPAELVKIRLQIERNSSQPLYTGPRSCIRYIIAKRGFGGLYRGLVLTTLRDTPAFGVYFWVYHRLIQMFKDFHARRQLAASQSKPQVKPSSDPHSWVEPEEMSFREENSSGSYAELINPFEIMFCGGMAGMASWAVLHPLDVLKTLVQSTSDLASYEERKVSYIFRQQLKDQGPRFLFRGFVPTCIRGFPASAVIFLVYEWCIDLAKLIGVE